MLKSDHPTQTELLRAQREFRITKALGAEGVIRALDFQSPQKRPILVLEDIGGLSLKDYCESRALELGQLLDIAIKICAALDAVHGARVIHKDINPSNIILNPETGQVKLIDFGISTELSRETQSAVSPDSLEGTLAYISPEQTGRMNRALDLRTDLYSLGVTLYELLCRRRPFEHGDLMELVHAHLARRPVPPHVVRPEVPETLSAIVMKLMAKSGEERYQSAAGLRADLERCAVELREGSISGFPLGSRDRASVFRIPQKLYGRARALEALLSSFERVCRGERCLVLVSGESGSGKSVLVGEIRRPMVRERGYFIAGKYDQFRRDLPYAGLLDAFDDLLRQLLTESDEQLASWRGRLLEALGQNGRLLTELLPLLEEIIGPQPAPPPLGAQESQNRFNYVLQNFVRALARPEHPLVLFLDDLQWADASSLFMLEQLLLDLDEGHFLVIGAYRDKEAPAGHPLTQMVGKLRERGLPIESLSPGPLGLEHVGALIEDTLRGGADAEQRARLAALVLAKTHGNPFFVNQFLNTLYREQKITLDPRGGWSFELEDIEGMQITDNVVTLMAHKIERLPASCQRLLKVGSCIGSRFSLSILSTLEDAAPARIAERLWPALKAGLLLPLDGNYRYMIGASEYLRVSGARLRDAEFKFLHDRVQQAAYSLLTRAQQQALHLTVGRRMLASYSAERRAEQIIDIVNHLNDGVAQIEEASERKKLASMNLAAGRRAKSSAAFEPALRYFTTGCELLTEESWRVDYELALALHRERAEALYLTADYETLDALTGELLGRCRELRDKVELHKIRLQALTGRGAFPEAIREALQALALVGVTIPEHPSARYSLYSRSITKLALLVKRDEDFETAPMMRSPLHLEAMRILMLIVAPAYFSNPGIVPVVVFTMMQLLARYGSSPIAAYACATYGFLQCGVFQNFEEGCRFGRLAERLCDTSTPPELQPQVILFIHEFVTIWTRPLSECIEALLDNYQRGPEVGEKEYVTYRVNVAYMQSILGGQNLQEIERTYAPHFQYVRRFRQGLTDSTAQLQRQFILHLSSPEEPGIELVGAAYNADEFLASPGAEANITERSLLTFMRCLLALIFRDTDRALAEAERAEPIMAGVIGQICYFVFFFAQSLAITANYHRLGRARQKALRKTLLRNRKLLQKWASFCPGKYAHKQQLVEAEWLRVRGRLEEARPLYEAAIEGAHEHGFIHEAALACELYSEFHQERRSSRSAAFWIREARYLYRLWGAINKVNALSERYPEWLASERAGSGSVSTQPGASTQTSSGAAQTLDLQSIMKASHAISGEIVLSKLLTRLMEVLIENAGAQFGALLLPIKDAWLVVARGEVGAIEVLNDAPLRGAEGLPSSIINYSIRARREVVLNNARDEGDYTEDPYVKANSVRSALALPLENQGKVAGLVYLENKLARAAFPPERLEVLRLISSQAAISLENARHYERQAKLTSSFARFVPREFIENLGHDSIEEVTCGEGVHKQMTVLFADIRDFTALSEGMLPEENFRFINGYLSLMDPVIRQHGGFIDKFIGDAIMALFETECDDVVTSAIGMHLALVEYNKRLIAAGGSAISIGVGVNTGNLMLGTVGGESRMEGTVIGDTVNLAARVESMTKDYGAGVLIGENTYRLLKRPEKFLIREVDLVRVKGKMKPVTIYEVFDGDSELSRRLKQETRELLQRGRALYRNRRFEKARECFEAMLEVHPGDMTAALYVERCDYYEQTGLPDDWDGTEIRTRK